MNPDGLSYLEMASHALGTGPFALINGLWSPGYPALISIALRLLRPSPHAEFPVVQLVSFLTYVLDLSGFCFFLKQWQLRANPADTVNDESRAGVAPMAFCIFMTFTLRLTGIDAHPDLLVAAILFFAAGVACRITLPGASLKYFLALGFVLGLGYYAKLAMFPLSLLFLAVLCLRTSLDNLYRRRLLLSFLVFLLTAAPLVALNSRKAGRLSLGDAGRLNYLWHVNGLSHYFHSTDENPVSDNVFEHPPRRLMEKPGVLEFSSPIDATMPLFYDPSYWYSGAKPRLNFHEQLFALKTNLAWYRDVLFASVPSLSVGAMVLFAIAWVNGGLSVLRKSAWLMTFAIAAFAMYALVWVEMRYVTGFFILLFVVLYGSLMSAIDRRVAAAVCAVAAGTVMIPLVAEIASDIGKVRADLMYSTLPPYERAALELRGLGLKSGDRLAVIGDAFGPYYAHYDRLRVTVAIPDTQGFWDLNSQEETLVIERLEQVGIRAVVTRSDPRGPSAGQWRRLASGNLKVLLLQVPI